MGAVGQADRGRGPRHFLHGDDMLEIAEAEAAIFLLDSNAVQAIRHLRPQLAREPVLRVDLGGQQRDLVGGEAPRRLADRVRHLAEEAKSSPSSDIAEPPVGLGPSSAAK